MVFREEHASWILSTRSQQYNAAPTLRQTKSPAVDHTISPSKAQLIKRGG
jgi:hypothetical protein